ncbi:AAA family ATPase [Ramlibacter rhizophilus]|uniref:LuxR family transcriptional regulator n=1 Tax=Ramlibacter rhizophilus TaxID=1781167 RepID=A0A4Z0BZB1_9BURK|nr:LuxR family transcriptional regulator [Ramlibacter rhizophilus]TFZ04563.1 LuxR family transcriptional regulator [Ramlibacter rhizophilus]
MANLLEREHAIAGLEAARARARDGAGSTVLVLGEAGIGKTALLDDFVRRHRGIVLWGGCEALTTPRPLGPLYDFADAAGSRLRAVLGGSDRGAMFASVLDEAASGEWPGVIVIDDVHWADDATFDFIRFAGRRIHRRRALLLLSSRYDEPSWRKVRAMLADLPAAHVLRIELTPLSLEAVSRWSNQAEADARRLHAVTNGNPFFVAELLRHRASQALPASVQDAVLGKVFRLPGSAREFIELVAIFPRHVELAFLERLRPTCGSDLDSCISAGLLLRNGPTVRFRHELARTAIECDLPEALAVSLHEEVLAALEQEDPDSTLVAQLAHHAGRARNLAAVLRWCPLAARQAAARGANREAASHARAALAHGEQLTATGRAELLRCLAAACFELSELDEAARAYREAAAIFERQGDQAARAACLAELAMPLVRALRNAEADSSCREALAVAAECGNQAVQARAFAIASYLHMLNRDHEQAVAAGRQALALARMDDDVLQAQAYKTVGSATIFSDYDAGCLLIERSMEIARALDDGGVALVDAYLMIGTASGELHRFENAERWIDEGLACARTHDLDRLANYLEAWRAICHVYRGEWDQAGPLALRVLAREPHGSTSRVMALVALGRLRTRRGDPGASDALDEALELAQRSGTLQRLAPVRAARAEAAWLVGDDVRAAAEAASVHTLAVAKGHTWFSGELAYWAWRAGRAEVSSSGMTPFDLQVVGDWRQAAAVWQTMGCPYEHARSLSEGDAPARRRALRMLDAMGAHPLAQRLRRQMRTEGVPAVPRGPLATTRAHPAGLTRREVEVLALLAQQLTTPEIASRLSRSHRTVDHHVESLCAKLGVRGRAEAVRAARRLQLTPPLNR